MAISLNEYRDPNLSPNILHPDFGGFNPRPLNPEPLNQQTLNQQA